MNTNLRTLVFGLGMATLGAVGATAATAVAQPGAERPGMHERGPHAHGPKLPGARFAHAVARLDLTADQEALNDDLKESTRDDMKALHEAHKADMEGLKDQFLGEGEVDRAGLHAMLDEHAADRLALAHGFLDRVIDLRDTLTPEQKAEIGEMAEEMEARRAERMERFESGDAPRRRGRR